MSASPEKLHELLMYCIDFSKTMLEDAGNFYPFGATLSPQGVVTAAGAYNGEEQPKPAEVYQILVSAFTAGAREGNLLGAALAANVNVPSQYKSPSPDALRVQLESHGYSRFMYVPYRITKQGFFKKKNTVEFHEPFAVEITPAFFISP